MIYKFLSPFLLDYILSFLPKNDIIIHMFLYKNGLLTILYSLLNLVFFNNDSSCKYFSFTNLIHINNYIINISISFNHIHISIYSMSLINQFNSLQFFLNTNNFDCLIQLFKLFDLFNENFIYKIISQNQYLYLNYMSSIFKEYNSNKFLSNNSLDHLETLFFKNLKLFIFDYEYSILLFNDLNFDSNYIIHFFFVIHHVFNKINFFKSYSIIIPLNEYSIFTIQRQLLTFNYLENDIYQSFEISLKTSNFDIIIYILKNYINYSFIQKIIRLNLNTFLIIKQMHSSQTLENIYNLLQKPIIITDSLERNFIAFLHLIN